MMFCIFAVIFINVCLDNVGKEEKKRSILTTGPVMVNVDFKDIDYNLHATNEKFAPNQQSDYETYDNDGSDCNSNDSNTGRNNLQLKDVIIYADVVNCDQNLQLTNEKCTPIEESNDETDDNGVSDCNSSTTRNNLELKDKIIHIDTANSGNCSHVSACSSSLPLFRKYGKSKAGKEMRRNCCPYCKNFVTNFGRHLVAVHKDEKEVQDYLDVKSDNLNERKRKRAAIANKLRKKGNHMYSINNHKVLIPTKRSSVSGPHLVPADTYVGCKFCFGLYKKKYFYLHLQSCEKYQILHSSAVRNKKLKHATLCSFAELITPNLPQASELLKKDVLPTMLKDMISLTAQSDPLILLYASRFYNTHRNSVKYTSAKMRALARVLIEIKNKNPSIDSMYDCLKPENFNDLMFSIRQMSKYVPETGECSVPGAVPPLCQALKTCSEIFRSETIKNPNLSQQKKNEIYVMMDGFEHLMKKEWSHEVSAIAEQSRKKRKINKEDVIPDSQDIRDFWVYLEQSCDSAIIKLKQHQTPKNYDRLSKIIMGQIITLNRRRPGEVFLTTLENYAQADVNDNIGALDETTLTEKEKKNAKDLSIFYISASKNRKKVPVILTVQMKRAINVLIGSREQLDIHSHLLFERPGNGGSYEGYDILGDLKKKTHLRNPKHFTATGLRHHAATSSQLHCRDDTYTKRLAKFMGHDLKTHETYYEMPLPLVQKGKVGTRLMDMTMPRQPTRDDDSSHVGLEKTSDEGVLNKKETKHIPDVTMNKKLDISVTKKSEKSRPASKQVSNDSDVDYEPIDSSSEHELQITPKKKCRRVRWTQAEKNAIYKHLGKYFIMKEAPERKVIKKVYENELALKNRTLQQVCTYVSNIVTNKLSIPTPEKEKIRRNFLH